MLNEISFEIRGSPIAKKRHRTKRQGAFIKQYDVQGEAKCMFIAKQIHLANNLLL
jgi:hypothetical protein